MNCRVFEDNISYYLDGELRDIDKIEFELHLLKCKDCRQKYENMINIVKLLKEKNEVELPREYHNILIKKINNVKTERKKSFNNWRIWTSIAATLIIFISSALIFNNINNITKDESILETEDSKVIMEASDLRNKDIVENKNDESIIENESKNEELIASYGLMSGNNDEFALNDSKMVSRASRSMVYKRKLIKQENIEILVSPYDNTVKNITEYIEEFGGYVESLTLDYGTVEEEEKTFYIKNGNIKLRVVENEFEDAVDFIKRTSDIENYQHIEHDITETYSEKENIINSLKSQEDKIVGMIKQMEDADEIVELEKELEKIRTDIESNIRELQNLDSIIHMPEINLNLKEVNHKKKDLNIFSND